MSKVAMVAPNSMEIFEIPSNVHLLCCILCNTVFPP
jgi:hypothetical protein